MDASAIIDSLGGNSLVAQKLSIKRSTVSMWKVAGIPARHWLSISRLQEAKDAKITPEVLEASRGKKASRRQKASRGRKAAA